MDYSRFNYVAQPEDNIPVEDLIPKIGPYDKWATMWGYKPIPGAKTPDEEKKTLDEWAANRIRSPGFASRRRMRAGPIPGENTEAVGDADAVASTGLGNQEPEARGRHVVAGDLAAGRALRRSGRALRTHAGPVGHGAESRHAGIVGGFNSQQKHAGQDGVRFTIVPREKQAAAGPFPQRQRVCYADLGIET